MDELYACIAFSHFLGIGPVRFAKLIEIFDTPEKAYAAGSMELREVLGASIGQKFIEFRNTFDPKKVLAVCKRKGITVLSCFDSRYPQQLKEISDPPICLYVRGDLSSISFEKDIFFGIVGTRRVTSYGSQVTHLFSAALSQAQAVVVSGLAIGVDTIAHTTAIDSGGKTVAFLGCGVDIAYPSVNRQLYERIASGSGLVISEFPPGMTVLPGLFVARNRLISGLSKGVLVVEGTEDSGAMITARYAAEQGKDVFAPPAPITSGLSKAPNILIRSGATMVISPDEVLEFLHMKRPEHQSISLTEIEQKIYSILQQEPYTSDELSAKISVRIHQLLPLLTTMELKSVIVQNQEGKYQIRSS